MPDTPTPTRAEVVAWIANLTVLRGPLAWRDIDRACARAALALLAEADRLAQALTDEQAAHALTARTLADTIRANDKQEQYRVERDQARAELKRRARLAMLAEADADAHADCATMEDVYREVVCRALAPEWDRAPDALRERWDAMRPGYLWWGRALGAFVATVVAERTRAPDPWGEEDAVEFEAKAAEHERDGGTMVHEWDRRGSLSLAARYRRAAQRARQQPVTEEGR